jgi:hypothetical protein
MPKKWHQDIFDKIKNLFFDKKSPQNQKTLTGTVWG